MMWRLKMRMKAALTFRVLGYLAAAGVVLVGATACSETNPGSNEATVAATRFHDHVRSGDPEGACSLLAPGTVEKLEDGEPGSCATKLRGLDLRAASSVLESKAYGSDAQVVMDQDTVFLVQSGHSWKITAAGCTSRGERPYQCLVEGS